MERVRYWNQNVPSATHLGIPQATDHGELQRAHRRPCIGFLHGQWGEQWLNLLIKDIGQPFQLGRVEMIRLKNPDA